jgi:tRNA threonylcarbamoyladenosine biosynthesis protein TsaB
VTVPAAGDASWVLALDASTAAASVAVLRDGVVFTERDAAMRAADAERLMPAVAAALDAAGIAPIALRAIVCGGGPGSFTSLRIAGAIAKGIATVTAVPLLAAPSLALAAAAHATAAGRWLVTLDAMRGERYVALVTLAGGTAGAPACVVGYDYLGVRPADDAVTLASSLGARGVVDANASAPAARGAAAFALALPTGRTGTRDALTLAPVALGLWEPDYGRKAEAQVKWEIAHGRALPAESTGALTDADSPSDPSGRA